MNHSRQSPVMNRTAACAAQGAQKSGSGHKRTRAGEGPARGTDTAGADDTGAALDRVTAGIREGAPPRQFMDSIDAGSRQLGNRAFMYRVGQLHADKAAAPVQMQGKKDKRNKDNRPEEEGVLDLPALEAAPPALLNSGNPGVLDTVDSDMDIQQVESELESEISGAVDDISAIVSDFGDEADEPGAGDIPAGASSCNMQTFIAPYFPVISSIYKLLTDRAGHVQTEDHGAFSLPGAGNALATVMLGILMVGLGLPLDIFGNILGGMARCIMLISHIFFGKPATWLLNYYSRRHPPSDTDRARVESEELPVGPPRGIDWNVSIPEMIAISGISAYWQAGSTQSSLSPRQWLQPWTPARIASIIVRTIVNDIVYLLQFTIFPQISQRILQNRLDWGETRAGLFVSVLNNIFDVVSNYILSYLTNMPLAVFLVFQNLIDDNDMTPTEAAAAVMGYAAVGMLIQIASEAIFEHFVVSRVNGENLVPWLNQFRAIPNRCIRWAVIALASFRNVIINVLSISLTTGQLSANIIGPLSIEFGQGGACFWPLAVSRVCGGIPAGFNESAQDARIAAGEENMEFGQLFAIQIFPWLVGLAGLGIPIAYVGYRYRQAIRAGRVTPHAGLEEIGSVLQDDNRPPEADVGPDAESQAPAARSEDSSQLSGDSVSGTLIAPTDLTAEQQYDWLMDQETLTPADLTRILNQSVAAGNIMQDEAAIIEYMVKEFRVLSKGGSQLPVEDVGPDAESQTPAARNEDSSQLPGDNVSGTLIAPTGLTAEQLYDWLMDQETLTPAGLTRILNQSVAAGNIMQHEAAIIENMVKEIRVLSKDRSQ